MTRIGIEMPNRPPTLEDAQRFTTTNSAEEWHAAGWSNEPASPREGPRRLVSVISLRLEYATVSRFRRVARLRGRTLSEFLRVAGDELAAKIEREEAQSAKVISVSFSGDQKGVTTTAPATAILTGSRDVVSSSPTQSIPL